MENYQKVKKIGHGTFGDVILAECLSDHQVLPFPTLIEICY